MHTDDNGTTHTDSCWANALDCVDQNATADGCTPAGPWGWLETDTIPEWSTTPAALASVWLSDGTASCYCK